MLLRLGIAAALAVTAVTAQESTSDRFEKKIRPVLAQRCYPCHSTAAAAPQGGLLLDSAGSIRRGGNRRRHPARESGIEPADSRDPVPG